MLKNHFIIAYRNIKRGGIYSVINILGLSIGLACFFLIVLYVRDEMSYDKFNSKHKSIYRVIGILDLEGQGEQSSSCPFPVGPALAHEYPHLIKHAVRFFNFQDPQHTLKAGDKKINESRIYFADSNVLNVFDFPLASGVRDQVLAAPNTIVLTRALAEKYFGSEDPIGKILKYDGVRDLMVTGIFGDLPAQSHIHFDALISLSTLKTMMGNQQKNWVWNPNWTYVELKQGIAPAQLEKEFPAFIKKHYPDFLKPQVRHLLQPLTNIHLHSKYAYEMEPNSDYSLVYIFSIIGLFILFIACINFMNLSTARSAGRAKEVGIRKVAGAGRIQLASQFLMESLLLSCIAVVFSVFIARLFLPVFNQISDKQLSLLVFTEPFMLIVIISVTLLTGILSGLYPAFYLSKFQPVDVLKGRLSSGSRNTGLRKALVIFQFAISVMLICGTGMVSLQLDYLRSAPLGFNRNNVLLLPVRPPMQKMFDAFINELKAQKDIVNVATMNDVIGKHHNTHEYNYKGMQPGKWIYFPSLLVNEDFISTMELQLKAGRDFSKAFPRDDSMAVIINEAMVKHMHWESAEKAIGEQFYTPTGYEKIVGVVKDFHFESLHTPLGPFVLDVPHIKNKPYWTRYIVVRLKPGNTPATIASIEKMWNRYSTEFPFEYFFLDEDLNKQYKAQENLAKLIACFSVLAIFIACIGLFALAAYCAEQRTKEIGIRKVMGASVMNITNLLTADFLKLVLIAVCIAWPLSYYAIKQWLQNFAFRTEISWLLFGIAGIAALFIAWITVVFNAAKAAKNNPSKNLKYE